MAGSLELINTYNFTGGVADTGTTIDGVFTSDYDNYEIYLSGADGGTAQRVVIIRLINSSGVVSTTTYRSSQLYMGNATPSGTDRYSSLQTSSRRFFVLSNSVEGGGAKINVYNPFDSNYITLLHYRTGDGVSGGLRQTQGIINEITQQSITGIHFFMDSSGTIDNLDVSVFGVK